MPLKSNPNRPQIDCQAKAGMRLTPQLKFMQDSRDKLRLGIPVTPPASQWKIEEFILVDGGSLSLPGEILRKRKKGWRKFRRNDSMWVRIGLCLVSIRFCSCCRVSRGQYIILGWRRLRRTEDWIRSRVSSIQQGRMQKRCNFC